MAMINGTSGDDLLFNTVGEADTIDGGSGNDTVSYAGAGGGLGVLVDLSFGQGIDFGNGDIDELHSIENVIGSSFDDGLVGDTNANVLDGGAGVDALFGGDGADTASYASATHGATVDLSLNAASDDGHGTTDSLFEMENLRGSAFGDSLTGDDLANVLHGGAGNDTLQGGAGNDTLQGGAGNDTIDGGAGVDLLDFSENTSGFSLTLGTGGSGTATVNGTDTYSNMEGIVGGSGNDTLTGNAGANVLMGGDGADVFNYSFDLTPGAGETFHFTEFFADHGGKVVNGEVADGTKQGQFSSLYTQWLESLGLTVRDLGQNSGPGGMPVVEGPEGTFGERESFSWTSGSGKKAVTHERWYSDTWSSGGGEDSVTSNDGLDTILDFTSGMDKLDFSDITQQQFEDHFTVAVVGADTVITMDGPSDWQLTLSGVTNQLAPGDIIFA